MKGSIKMEKEEVTPELQDAIDAIILVLKEKRLTFKEAALIFHLTRIELGRIHVLGTLLCWLHLRKQGS
jgi:hypothetical protein